MSWLLRFLLVIFLVRALWRLLMGIVQGASAPAGARPGPLDRGVPLVRDPVCGTFVVRSRALTSGVGDHVQYFCSETCRQAYATMRR